MPQAAYDVTSPNGSARLPQGERVIAVFRLYRRVGAAVIGDVAGAEGDAVNSFLGDVRETVRAGRQLLQKANQFLQGGRVLEREYQFVMFIEQLTEAPAVRTRFSYVRNGYFVDVLPNAQGVTQWRLAGRTHWTPVLVNGVPVDGDAALKDLKELIEDRFFPPDGSSAGDYELYWFNYLSAISAEDPFGAFEWLIHPVRHGLQVQQIAARPFQRSFTFEFLGLRNNQDVAKSEDGFLDGLLSQGFLKELLDYFELGALATALEEIFGIIEEVRGLLEDAANVVTAVTDYALAVQQTITSSIAKVRGLLTGVQTIIGRIEDGLDLIRDIPDLTEEQWALVRQNYPGLSGGDSEQTAYAALRELRALRTLLSAVVIQPAFTAPLAPRQQTIALDVQVGTSLDRLARDTGVTPELLVLANDLRHPFIDATVRSERIHEAAAAAAASAPSLGADPVGAAAAILSNAESAVASLLTHPGVDDSTKAALRAGAATAKGLHERVTAAGMGAATPAELQVLQAAATAAATFAAARPSAPKVLYAGDRIRVPQPSGNVLPSVVGRDGNQILATGEALTEEERLFGIDFVLNDNGDLEWDPATFDLKLARGLTNMDQVQRRYVKLPLGALRFAPGIGNFAYADIAKWQGPGTNRLLAYAMYVTLSQDPRIKRVRNIRAETRGGVSHLVYDALLINGKDVPALRAPVS